MPVPAPKTVTVDAILFDMDGTLIDSTPGLYNAWAIFCTDYGLGDTAAMVHATHGKRLYDTLKDICGIQEEQQLLAEIERFEEQVIKGGPVVLPGVLELLSTLNSLKADYTIVTSATNYYAPRALKQCGIPLPDVKIVTSNDVTQGKPHPEPYIIGAAHCRANPAKCLVVEDAISGLKAGRAAGATTLAVCTSTSRDTLEKSDANPDFIVPDLTHLQVRRVAEGIELTINVPE
ncbi:HAD-like domain-containing protein [Rhodocollybia butyracea]|uniref:HAD-like domain-containing protein n=1 Tax=Rhodocollybia butyracea TaxID=206335 RepID=A0A9P5Q0M6_9AGAR|nr:HAD-like domain-containing protein [Rhodocollybia butyracea]